jgi:hypothetical protein
MAPPQVSEEDSDVASCPRWQEAYACLLLLEKGAQAAGLAPLAWGQGAAAHKAWGYTGELLLHQHLWAHLLAPPAPAPVGWACRCVQHPPVRVHHGLPLSARPPPRCHRWVRKAAARLLGLGLAAEQVAGGLLEREGRAGELALRLYMQLEAEVVDEPLCLQVRVGGPALSAGRRCGGGGGRRRGGGGCCCGGTLHEREGEGQRDCLALCYHGCGPTASAGVPLIVPHLI